MRRTMSVIVALLLLGVAAPSWADTVTPSPGTQTFTTTDALVSVLDGPTNTHQATIDTRLYVPSGAKPGTPQPAILMTHGFGLTKLGAEVVSTATFLARHGYVVLTYTAQGFGASSGCVTLQSRTYDVKDARQLIDKVLEPRADVRHDSKGAVVATVGGSYGGGIQLNLAEADARVRAIAPFRTWNTLQYSLDPNNYVAPGDPTGFTHTLDQQGVFKFQWSSLFFASGNGNPVGGIPPSGGSSGACPQDKVGEPTDVAGVPCLGFHIEVCETYARVSTTGDAQDADRTLLADSSGTTEIDKLTVPTLIVQGQSDTLFNLNDAVASYTALKRQGTPVQMIWNSGGHGGYDSLPGECEMFGSGTTGLDDCYLSLRLLTFFDHWLRGKADRSPGFTYFRDWVSYKGSGANDEQYGVAAAFPIAGPKVFTLSGTSLVTSGAVPGSAQVVNPVGAVPAAYTETSNFTGPDSSPPLGNVPTTEIPGQHADFTTAPFTVDTDSVGVPSARLRLAHTALNDLVLFGKVYDVAPDGSALLIHRLIAPMRIPSAALAAPVDVKLLGFAHRFKAGHRARLTLATTDTTSNGNRLADLITITSGPGSTFTLPVVARAAAPVARPVAPPVAAPVPAAAPAPVVVARARPALGLLGLALTRRGC